MTAAAHNKLTITIALLAIALAVGFTLWNWHMQRDRPNFEMDDIKGAGLAEVVTAVLPQGGRIVIVTPDPKANPHFAAVLDAFSRRLARHGGITVTAVEAVDPTDLLVDPEGVLVNDVLSPLLEKHMEIDAMVSLAGCANRSVSHAPRTPRTLLIGFCGATSDLLNRLLANGALDVAIVNRSDLTDAEQIPPPKNRFDQFFQVVRARQ